MKIKAGDWVWHNNHAYEVESVGDGQVTISHIDTPSIPVMTVNMADIEIMTYDEIEVAMKAVQELRWEMER